MTMLYSKIAKNLKGSAVMPLLWVVISIILFVTGKMWFEDYLTSWYGYESFPTNKATEVVWAVALLPQLIQMAASYITVGLIKETDTTYFGIKVVPVSIGIWFLAFLLDGYWDYLYKASDFISEGQHFYAPAIIESFGVYGLGSELLGTIALAIWVALIKEGAFTELIDLLVEVAEMLANAISLIIVTIGKIGNVLASPFKESKKPRQSSQQHRREPIVEIGDNNMPKREHNNPRDNRPHRNH